MKTSFSSQLCIVLALCLASTEAFFASKPAAAKIKSSPQADKAVEIFAKKFPFDRPPAKPSKLSGFGMPVRDIDGTLLKKNGTPGKRLTDISEAQARASFNELARLYGDDEALKMVKQMPICLTFNKDRFGPSLAGLSEVFGEEKAKGVVQRNPGLLAITPEDAARVTDQTLYFSYLVGFFAPVGPVLLPALLFALFSPAIEAVTGIPVQSAFLAALKGQ